MKSEDNKENIEEPPLVLTGMVEIGVNDLEDVVSILHLVSGAMQSQDVAENYNNLNEVIVYRPLTKEVERIHTRLSGFLKDYIYEKYQKEENNAKE